MRKKRCRCCGELYEAEPRSYRKQITCRKEECRAWRRRSAVKKWKNKNPMYVQVGPTKYQEWSRNNAGYWKEWRGSHPGYVERNRRAQRRRNELKVRYIAKGNDWNRVCIEKLRQISILHLIAKGNDWERVVRYQIVGICRYLEGQLMIAKRNDIDEEPYSVRE